MHSLHLSLLLSLFPLSFAQVPAIPDATPAADPQNEDPTPTTVADDLAGPQNGAIVPTATGQIGVNPVDLPPASDALIGVDTQYFTVVDGSTKWIGTDEWFAGTATIGAGQPSSTTIPKKGFQVTVAEDGSVDIALSQWVRDKLETIAEGLPACPLKRRRQDVSACTRRRTYQFAEEISRDSELMEQIDGLSYELADAVGREGYAAELQTSGETLTFGGADLVEGALQSLGAIPALAEASPMAVGVFGSVVLTAVSFNRLLEEGEDVKPMAWKFSVGKPESIPTPEPKGDDDEEKGCARKDEIPAPCGSTGCVGNEDDEDPKCTVGKYKDCPCEWEQEIQSQPRWEEWRTINRIFNSVSTELHPQCDIHKPSEFPESLFRNGVYDKFCEDADKDLSKGLTWIVDSEGNQKPTKAKRKDSEPRWLPRGHVPRSPPVKPDMYDGYIIELKWEPNEGGGACPKTCKDALLTISNSPCGHAGAQQNVMAGDTTYDVLCGQYSVTVQELEGQSDPPYRTAPAPERSARPTPECYERHQFGDHGEVIEEAVKLGAKKFCESHKGAVLNLKDGVSLHIPPNDQFNEGAENEPGPIGEINSWYTYAARWDDECGKDDEPAVVGEMEGLANCEGLLFNVYKHCDNGGTGGWIRDGCIDYFFRPYSKEETNDWP